MNRYGRPLHLGPAYKRKGMPWGPIVGIILVLLFAGFLTYRGWSSSITVETVTITDRWAKDTGGTGQKYLVSITDGEVLQVTDALLLGHFRASDVYAALDPGGEYTVRVSGWRIPFLSEYRNISKVVE